ncbi:hypothetical protein [Photorhabdus bodei]|uniref:Uncharacterized protein n=1 Tax=Photorhabdus bodei TaxID=2029681 RepID=A0A329X4S2_9GAMM|nr:hypothetical protein [Photorhabdus bodei]NDL00093.1 hypothetical protein [Photorhabdus bodei]NDL04228.1 hypothetical protein [Photorhabdus bodei]NDL08509.1 hypothetical protein [Photorhabdus bodei]RAX11874.1 hypothetical protein CKY02_12205 [Photorhabdus bodei]
MFIYSVPFKKLALMGYLLFKSSDELITDKKCLHSLITGNTSKKRKLTMLKEMESVKQLSLLGFSYFLKQKCIQ